MPKGQPTCLQDNPCACRTTHRPTVQLTTDRTNTCLEDNPHAYRKLAWLQDNSQACRMKHNPQAYMTEDNPQAFRTTHISTVQPTGLQDRGQPTGIQDNSHIYSTTHRLTGQPGCPRNKTHATLQPRSRQDKQQTYVTTA